MSPKEPSRTARGAAGHRAAHQLREHGAIFRDPFARRILGAEDLALAEDALSASFARGVRQAVILGAGFDTFALRNPHAATQAWKRARLAAAGIAVPATSRDRPAFFVWLGVVPAELHAALRARGFDEIEDFDFTAIASRYAPERPLRARTGGGHLIRARAA
jgi:O-methyltransferase involved in polyketide biosynthesis